MAAQLVATTTLGGALPLAVVLQTTALGAIKPQVEGLLLAQARLTVTPPSAFVNLQIAQQIVASLQASITFPSVDFQLSAIAAALAQLQLLLESLEVGLGVGGISVYTVTSDAQHMGSDLQGAIGAGPPGTIPTSPVGGVLLAASSPAARFALGNFCGVNISSNGVT